MAQARVKAPGRKSPARKSARQPSEDLAAKQKRMLEILRVLKRTYPDAECSLVHANAFQLLISTILSAQCTDERVNKVTPALFAKYPDAQALAKAPIRDVEKLIQTTGFFRSKALSVTQAARAIVEQHGGELPRTLEELVKLRGVGRKTANVVLGVAYGVPGMVVDTHVGRLSRRMGFTREMDPVRVEHELMEIVPKEDWVILAHLLIFHGRAICIARQALCEECPVAHLCPKIGV